MSPASVTHGASGKDVAGVADFTWRSDRFNYGAGYSDIGEHFNAEMGFIPRVDIRYTRARAGWTPRPKWKGVRQLVFAGSIDYFEDHSGRVDSRTQSFDFNVQQQDT